MISVTVYKDRNNHYTGFRCDGHAEYAEPGEDMSVVQFQYLH